MEIQKVRYEQVAPDGVLPDNAGAVVTDGCVRRGTLDGGQLWLLVLLPRTEDGIVEGTRVVFDNLNEMEQSMYIRL